MEVHPEYANPYAIRGTVREKDSSSRRPQEQWIILLYDSHSLRGA